MAKSNDLTPNNLTSNNLTSNNLTSHDLTSHDLTSNGKSSTPISLKSLAGRLTALKLRTNSSKMMGEVRERSSFAISAKRKVTSKTTSP